MLFVVPSDSDSSSGGSSPVSRSSPVSAHTNPSLSKLPAAEQSRVSEGPSLVDNRTPPPRQIPLFRITPTSTSWKQRSTSASPPTSRPALGIVPLSKESPKKEKDTEQEKLPTPATVPKGRLLSLLKSKSKVGNFHNVTLNKGDMQQVSRSGNTKPEFISVNHSARVRPTPHGKVAKRPGEAGHTNLGELAHEKLTPYEVFKRSRTFSSSVKNLLRGDISNETAKKVPDVKVQRTISNIETGHAHRSDAVEKPQSVLRGDISNETAKKVPDVKVQRTISNIETGPAQRSDAAEKRQNRGDISHQTAKQVPDMKVQGISNIETGPAQRAVEKPQNLLRDDISDQTAKQIPDVKVQKTFFNIETGPQRSDAVEKPQNLLQGDISDQTAKQVPDVKVQKMLSNIETGPQRSDAVEKPQNLLRDNISSQTAKHAPDVQRTASNIKTGPAQRSDVEKPPSAKKETRLPSDIKDASRKIGSSVTRKRSFDAAMAQDQELAASVALLKKYSKVRQHDTAGAKDRESNADIVPIDKDSKEPQNDTVVAKDRERHADIESTNKPIEALRSDAVTAETQQRKGDAASLNKTVKVPRRDIEPNYEEISDASTVSLNNFKPHDDDKVTDYSRVPSVASLLNSDDKYDARNKSSSAEIKKNLPTAVPHISTLTTDHGAKSTDTVSHKVPLESSESNNSIREQKEEQFNKENNALKPMHPTTDKKSVDSEPLKGIAEKWNKALLQEPPNSSSQRQALADLFSKLYQNNMLIKSENISSIDGSTGSTSGLDGDRKQERIVEARIVTDLGLLNMDENKDKRSNITNRQKPHHLRGAVVIQDTAPVKLAASEQLEENKSVSKELFYLTESDETLSENEEEAQKDLVKPGRKESTKAHSSVQRPVSHVTLHENSIDRPISGGKDSLHQDPEVERKKIDRELAIKVTAKFDEKSWFNKSTVMNLVEPGIAKHSSMASHPKVSVTNNICSTENYEHSHAYYYQQLHTRSKLEFIPLRGPLAAEFGNRGKPSHSNALANSSLLKQDQLPENRPGEMWKRSWRALLQKRSILLACGPAPGPQKSDLLHNKKIAQLKRIFESEFGTKIASQLNGDVEIIISSDSLKATKAVESILNDPVRASNLNRNLRVWSIEKAYQFLENMGINVKEWTSGVIATEKSAPEAALRPFTDTTKADAETATVKEFKAKKLVAKEPVAKERLAEEPTAEKRAAKEPTAKERIAEEPTAEKRAAKEPTAKEQVAEGPAAEKPVTKGPIVKEQVVEEPTAEKRAAKEPIAKEQVAEEPTAEKSIAKGPTVKERIAEEPTTEKPAEKRPTSKEPLVEEPTAEPVAKGPTAEDTIEREPYDQGTVLQKPPAKEPAAKPLVRVFASNMAPLTKAFTVQPSNARLGVNRILGSKTRIRDTTASEKTTTTTTAPDKPAVTENAKPAYKEPPQQTTTTTTAPDKPAVTENAKPAHREPPQQTTQTDSNELQQPQKTVAEIVDVDIGKTDSETESDALADDSESLLRKAAEQLEKKDKQIEAARKLILALCQDVMKKELEITSLHGQLKVSEQQLKEKDQSIEDYTEALIQRELELRKIAKNKRVLANRFD